ncbi:MAG: hypothetical protein ACK5B9_01990 [Flavobacteriia bacterium]
MKIIGIILLYFSLQMNFYFAQDEGADPIYYKLIIPKHSYSIDFALPVPIANKPFKGIMQGLVRFSGSYQYALKSNLSVGLGFNYTYFYINRFKITPQILGGMHLGNAYFKLAYEKYTSERVGYDVGVKIGYSRNYFHSDSLQTPNIVQSTIVEPYAAFCLTASEKTAYKWMVSYSFLGFGFTPERIGDFVNQDYQLSEYKRVTRFLSFGFSYSHYFKQW